MALERIRNDRTERLQSVAALSMALFEQSGLRALIDSKFRQDPRNKLSPGNAVKAMIGDMMRNEERRPLFGIADLYATSPTDLLFGKGIDVTALNATAFSRNLDRLFKLDLGQLAYECYCKLKEFYGLESSRFSIDVTNFSVYSLKSEPDLIGAAFPERCGHAKDGHNERLVYSLLSITDDNGIVCYEKPYDGATTDGEMDRDAVEFLSEKVDPSSATLVADCKIVTKPLIELLLEKGFGFVSKCPENFGRRIKQTIIDSVKTGIMDPSEVREGWEIYDTDAEVNGKKLRFVAFRTTEDVKAGIDYLREQGGKEAKTRFARFGSRTFNCDVDARRAIDEAVAVHVDSAYVPEWTIQETEVSLGYGHRGRPKKDEKPLTKTEYKVDVKLRFDEERARELTQERGVRVLITNLPRANTDADNVRFGATADTVMKVYLDQYKIEHAFRLMKDGMGIDRVYLHRPSRENAMMFVISIATMLSDAMTFVMKSKGIDYTAQKLAGKLHTLDLVYDRGRDSERFDGNEAHIDLFMDCLEALRVDPDHLIH